VADASILERDVETAVLRAGARAASSGAGVTVLILGAAGVGKSRLLDHGRRAAAERRLRVLAGKGSELERPHSFGLLRQLFEPVLAAAPAPDRGRWLAGRAAPAAAILDRAGGAGSADDGALLDALCCLTANICRSSPLALALDDLQWADEASLRFLGRLLPRLAALPLLVMATAQPSRAPGLARMLDAAVASPACQLARPLPLTASATTVLLAAGFGQRAEPGFAAACHRASGGTPGLVVDLARALRAAGVPPTTEHAGRVLEVGGRALARRVWLLVSRLGRAAVRLAEAVAVLGPDATAGNAGRLAGLGADQVEDGLAELRTANVIRPAACSFVLPLVRVAVYDTIDTARRVGYHAAAAGLLGRAGAAPERVAAHLVQLPPTSDSGSATVLRQAAADALAREAPRDALRYLRRCLSEPLAAPDRIAVLTEAGRVAALVDPPAAAALLGDALAATVDPPARRRLIAELAPTLLAVGRPGDALALLDEAAVLPASVADRALALGACRLDAMLLAGAPPVAVRAEVKRLRDLRPDGGGPPMGDGGGPPMGDGGGPPVGDGGGLPAVDGLGAALLDAGLARVGAWRAEPGALDRAWRAVRAGAVRQAAADGAVLTLGGHFAVLVHDPDRGVAELNGLLEAMRGGGSPATRAAAHLLRGMAWLRRGDLVEAAADLRHALLLGDTAGVSFLRPVGCAALAVTLLEQGRAGEADTVLRSPDPPEPPGPVGQPDLLLARSRLLHAQHHPEAALRAALAAGELFAAYRGCNPAVLAWRSEAALCLHAMGRDELAREHAVAELALARRWGAGDAVGRALRVCGVVTPGPDGLRLLREAVEVLGAGSARLEHATALVELGAALRRGNARSQARPLLTAGFRLARLCTAEALAEHARAELRAAGAGLRQPGRDGPVALTSSERRVAMLAAQGLTNREIAHKLVISVKTVEVHLSAAYRKLGASGRHQLRATLGTRTGTLRVR
jgi:DNA-binding CsgD family transcriptional regulator